MATSRRQKRVPDYEFKANDFKDEFAPERTAAAAAAAARAAAAAAPAAAALDIVRFGQLVTYLGEWMRDMKAWGEDVRDDIIRLESAVGVAPGEPGDPPPAPRK